MGTKIPVQIGGQELSLSNLDKIFYTASGFTKGQVIDYYIRVADYLLPHLAGRPVTLKRYPDGAAGEFFYQKECPAHRPSWMPTAMVWSKGNRRNINYCLMAELPALVWAVNLAALELHTSLSKAKDIARPSFLVFDLDPGEPATILECAQVALWLKDFFEFHNLQSFPKTSGSKGLQVYLPLNTDVTYEETKPFARALAELLARKQPGAVVSNMRKSLRTGKVLLDWSQNDKNKTTVSVYSLRAREHPSVSTPVTWEEVSMASRKKDPALLYFEAGDVLKRIAKQGDLFAPVLSLKQKLPLGAEG